MGNKTLIPALKAHVGDWSYYICVMKYAQVAKEVGFAFELGGNSDLNTLIQRGISTRTKEIVDYLVHSPHRFLGSLIVAAWGGDPHYIPVKMDESDDMLQGLDSGFGVLTFDGSQQYFALDGQHRLRAIKEAIKKDPELGGEEISVILVSHYNTPEGQQKTRRLFSNINKNAKSTSPSENIALDEDDGYAIINRRLVEEDEFFSEAGRVAVFQKLGDEGELSIASSVRVGDKKALTSLKQLYEILKDLGFGLDPTMRDPKKRPTDEVLDTSYEILQSRVHELLAACGNIEVALTVEADARNLRAPKKQANGHAFMRGIVQRAVAKAIRRIMDQEIMTWEEALDRLRDLDWKLSSAPWLAVCNISDDGNKVKMLTNRDYASLLEDLIVCHIGPSSRQEIKRARKAYADLKGGKYPVSEEDLSLNIVEQPI